MAMVRSVLRLLFVTVLLLAFPAIFSFVCDPNEE
jgi:hypothetical protein